MSLIPDYTATAKALVESQLAAVGAIGNSVTREAEQALVVTIAAAKASTQASLQTAKKCLAANDAQAVIALATALGESNSETLAACASKLMDLRSTTRAELATIFTAQVGDAKSKVAALVDDVARNAPAGAERMFALLRPVTGTPTSPDKLRARP